LLHFKGYDCVVVGQLLKPVMLRRLKEDVERTLAPKEETIVEVRPHMHYFTELLYFDTRCFLTAEM